MWGVFAACAGAIIAGWLSRRTKISEFRQAWISELRADIAEFMGKAHLWIEKWEELNDLESIEERGARIPKESLPIANEALTILWRIKLRLNPRENPNKAQDSAFLASLGDLLDPGKLSPDASQSSWRRLAEKATDNGRELLKREWEVTKGGSWWKPWA